MGLMFDDSHEMRCPNCGNAYFYERKETMLEKVEDKFGDYYIEIDTKYNIRCCNCDTILDTGKMPKIKSK